jgi:hypothetical protein
VCTKRSPNATVWCIFRQNRVWWVQWRCALPEDINNSRRTANELRKVLDHLRITTVQFSRDCGLSSRHGKRLMSGRYDGKMPKVVDYVLWAYSLNCPRTSDGDLDLSIPLQMWMKAPVSTYRPQGNPRSISVPDCSDSPSSSP